MLTINNIDDFVQTLGINEESDFNLVNVGNDYIEVVDQNLDFNVVSNAISNNNVVFRKVIDNGVNYFVIEDTVYIEGMKTKVNYLCSKSDIGYGTTIKMIVKSIYAVVSGELKLFTGFEALNSYKERFVVNNT